MRGVGFKLVFTGKNSRDCAAGLLLASLASFSSAPNVASSVSSAISLSSAFFRSERFFKVTRFLFCLLLVYAFLPVPYKGTLLRGNC